MGRLRINFFSLGDCRNINTWSQFPYYFHRALLKHDVTINPINLIPSENRAYHLLCKFRSRSNYLLTNMKLRSAARQWRDVDLNVFMTFSFSSYGYVDVPVVHYCDRTYEHHLEESGRKPTARDHMFIKIDRQNLENAALVLTTNQLCCDFITNRYNAKRVIYLRAGVNTDLELPNPEDLILTKEKSKDILFIGRGAYKRGVDILLKAFRIFNERCGREFMLHIVGVAPQELPRELQAADANIRFYGYLDKTVPEQRERYYRLLQSAKLFVFPMRPSPVAGVIREAQMLCTPVIISNVSSASERVTNNYNGILVDRLEPEEFAQQMNDLVKDTSKWRSLAGNAHLSNKDYTWDRTAETFLEIVDEMKAKR